MADTATAPAETPTGPDHWLTQPGHPWEALRRPFPEDQLELKPQPVSRNDQDKGRCEPGTRYSADGMHCGGWHSRSVHLTYVGHAGITDRLNEVCGEANWSLEPLAYGPDGLPVIRNGQLWVRLTIWGVSKIEVGDADGRGGYEEGKVIWSDALKRAAMRFGIGTYLWSKSDKAKALIERTEPEVQQQTASRPAQRTALTPDEQHALSALMREDDADALRGAWRQAEATQTECPDLVVKPGVDITREQANILGVPGPLRLLDVIGRIGKHLTEEGISVKDHIAAEAGAVPTNGGAGQ